MSDMKRELKKRLRKCAEWAFYVCEYGYTNQIFCFIKKRAYFIHSTFCNDFSHKRIVASDFSIKVSYFRCFKGISNISQIERKTSRALSSSVPFSTAYHISTALPVNVANEKKSRTIFEMGISHIQIKSCVPILLVMQIAHVNWFSDTYQQHLSVECHFHLDAIKTIIN